MKTIQIGKGKILQNARDELEIYRNSPEWLERNRSFDHDLGLSGNHEIIVKLFNETVGTTYKKQQKLLDIEILVANLIEGKRRRPTSISINANHWIQSQYRRASPFTLQLVRIFEEKGLINTKKGFRMETTAKTTRIWATEKLLEYCKELPNYIIREPVELVELRDDKGNLIEYRDTEKTHRIRTILQRVNEVNAKADILYPPDRINASLVAIFKEKFTLYGRLHTKGYRHYQGMKGNEREEITINGDRVIELDYSAMHPYLLYASEGIQYFGDPYGVIDKRPEVRLFMKHILLFMLNAKDRLSAERAANYWLKNNHEERIKLRSMGITRAKPLMEQFIEAHNKISHHFFNGKQTGMRIMNKDSAIALDVVNYFAKQKIPILAIHDSFLVQEQHGDLLRKVMQQSYKKHTGFRIKIK